MKLPLLLSVPHAGTRVPEELAGCFRLSLDQIVKDGDEQAAEIYALQDRVEAFLTTDVARAVVDLNRAEDDRRPDGVVKTHTCWNEPVYDAALPDEIVDRLLERYHRPYHERLRELARTSVRLGVDCHTMAAEGPPIGPDHGQARPAVCLGDGDGALPAAWFSELVDVFRQVFHPHAVRANEPFRGGYITRHHATELPWVQLELSRGPFLPVERKRERVAEALAEFCGRRDWI